VAILAILAKRQRDPLPSLSIADPLLGWLILSIVDPHVRGEAKMSTAGDERWRCSHRYKLGLK
jgi:hypothetical protein